MSEAWKDQIKRRSAIVQRSLSTPEGRELLSLLEQTFQSGDLLGEDPQKTGYRVGQFEVVAYLKELNNLNTAEDK